jgi:hypothetical protein
MVGCHDSSQQLRMYNNQQQARANDITRHYIGYLIPKTNPTNYRDDLEQEQSSVFTTPSRETPQTRRKEVTGAMHL